MAVEGFGIQLSLDDGDVKKGLNNIAKDFEAFSSKIQSIGESMSAFITAPLLAFGAQAVKSASDLEETQSKFNAVFKDLSGEVRKFAEEQANALGRAQGDIEGYLASVQDTFVPMGIARGEASELSKSLVSLGMDLASFNNEAESDVLANLRSALVGNHDAVSRFGIIINDATLSQELFNMGIEGGTRKASEAQKVQARLNIIMKSSADAIGDAARTSGSFANQMRAMQARLGDVSEVIGAKLMPIVKNLVKDVIDLAKAFNSLDNSQKNMVILTGAIASAMGPMLVVIGKALPLLKNLALAFRTASLAVGPLALKIGLVVAGIAGAVLVFTSFAQTINTLFPKIGEFIAKVLNEMQSLFSVFVAKIETFVNFLSKLDLVPDEWVKDLAEFAKNLSEPFVAPLAEFTSNAKEVFEKNLSDNFATMLELAKSAGGGLESAFMETFSNLKKAYSNLADSLFGETAQAPEFEGGGGGADATIPTNAPINDAFLNIVRKYSDDLKMATAEAQAFGEENKLVATDIGLLKETISSLLSEGFAVGDDELAPFIEKLQGLKTELVETENAFLAIADTIGDSFGKAFADMATGADGAAQSVREAVLKTINAFINQAAAALAAGEAVKSSFLGLAGIALVSAVAKGVIGSLSGLTALATGGLVTGPTLALIGEGRESEAVLPISKIQPMINEAVANAGGGGSAPATQVNERIEVGRITGRSLSIVLDRETDFNTDIYGNNNF